MSSSEASSDEESTLGRRLAQSHTQNLVDQSRGAGTKLRLFMAFSTVLNLLLVAVYFWAATKVDNYHSYLEGEGKHIDCEMPWYTWYMIGGIVHVIKTFCLAVMLCCLTEMMMNEHVVKAQHYREEGRIQEAADELDSGGQAMVIHANIVTCLAACTTVCLSCGQLGLGIWGWVMTMTTGCDEEVVYFWYIVLADVLVSCCYELAKCQVQFPTNKPARRRPPNFPDV